MVTESTLEKRQYVRHKHTGDLAYLVDMGDRIVARLDRPDQQIDKPYSKDSGLWVPEDLTDRPFTKAQVSKVAFALDVAMCELLRMMPEGRRYWEGLKDSQRIEFISDGPRGPEIRRELWKAAMGVLNKLAK